VARHSRHSEPLRSGRRRARRGAGLFPDRDHDADPDADPVVRIGQQPPVPPPPVHPRPPVPPPAAGPQTVGLRWDDGPADDASDRARTDPPADAAEPPTTAVTGALDTAATGAAAVDTPPGARRATGRAGRDMASAIGVGLALGAVILAALLIWRPAFLLVLTAAVLVSIVELTGALERGGHHPPRVPVLVGAVAAIGLAWTRGPSGLVIAFQLTVLAVLLWRLGGGPIGYLRDASAGVLVALYVPLLAGFAVLLLVPDDGAARVLAFIATVVCSDVGGFAAGVLFGKHPMAPSVSPKKSWEGLAGSVSACVLIGVLLVTLTFHGPWWGGVLYGVAIALTATIGDLGESLIKRDLGIKDMGNLLPGHGGLMDRMDSLLPSAAVAYLLLSVVAPV
jgi:phosphatidate cytidylyltransferase